MVSPSAFRGLVPLCSLAPSDRADLARNARIASYRRGQVLFCRGEDAQTVVYLLSGAVELVCDSGTQQLRANTSDARHPIASGARRATTATCTRDGQAMFVDRNHLDLVLAWTQAGAVEVVEFGARVEESAAPDGDWMTSMLGNPALHRIPAGNIPRIFAALEPCAFPQGAVVIEQGSAGDYYYVVTQGTVRVRRGGGEVAVLGVGHGFGEDALVSGSPRSATVEAATDCHAMRLSASDFVELLQAPLLREVQGDAIPDEAQLLDVRLPDEFLRGRLPGSVNLPLGQLRKGAGQLAPDRPYVVYCDSGRRSAVAAYLLSERGFDARLLAGGVPAEEMPVRG